MEANNVPAITIAVSSHLCVICHHFSCLVLLFQGYVVCQNFNLTGSHPSSETQGQSVWLGGTTKVFKHRRKSPLVPILTGPLPNIQANAGSWLGPQNALYYCAQSANSISWVFFREFVHNGYCLTILVRCVHQGCACNRLTAALSPRMGLITCLTYYKSSFPDHGQTLDPFGMFIWHDKSGNC